MTVTHAIASSRLAAARSAMLSELTILSHYENTYSARHGGSSVPARSAYLDPANPAFQDFATWCSQNQNSPEYPEFLIALARFSTLPPGGSWETEYASISDNFMEAGAPFEINLSLPLRSSITDDVAELRQTGVIPPATRTRRGGVSTRRPTPGPPSHDDDDDDDDGPSRTLRSGRPTPGPPPEPVVEG